MKSSSLTLAKVSFFSMILAGWALGLGGCAPEGNSTSQFRAASADGKTYSFIYFVGLNLPNAEDSAFKDKTYACWYRSDISTAIADQLLTSSTFTESEVNAVLFHKESKHSGLTSRFSECVSMVSYAQGIIDDGKDYRSICNARFNRGTVRIAGQDDPVAPKKPDKTETTILSLAGGNGPDLLGIFKDLAPLLPDSWQKGFDIGLNLFGKLRPEGPSKSSETQTESNPSNAKNPTGASSPSGSKELNDAYPEISIEKLNLIAAGMETNLSQSGTVPAIKGSRQELPACVKMGPR